MTRALLPLLGRSLLMLALCGAAVGCGDDDDEDDDVIGGTGGKSGSGGKSGTGGKSGSGGATAPTMAECVESFDEATPLPGACVECACEENPTAVTACGPQCWALMACVSTKCAAVLADTAATNACAGMMCEPEINAAAPLMMIGPSTIVGPILQGPVCGSKCAAAPPEGDAGVDAGGVDAGD